MPWQYDPVPPDAVADALDDAPVQSLSASAYWRRLRPRLRDFGISRVADITGLDRVGFPVAQVVRPGARSNAVTQGKGSTLPAAAVGAVLECLEMAAGENIERLDKVPGGDASRWSRLAPGLADGVVWPDAGTRYIAGYDLSCAQSVALPRDVISTDFARGSMAEAAPILRHSIGLGAGTTLGAAMMHGLLECVEADARLRADATGRAQRLSVSSDDPECSPLLARVGVAGLRAAIYSLPCKGGVFAIKASVMEAPGASALPLPATGYAARPYQPAAIAAALAEALQARLAAISGAREDITQRFYAHGIGGDDLAAEWARHGPATCMMGDPRGATPTLRELAALVGPVFVMPLLWDQGLPLAIVRIVAPALVADPLRLVSQ